MTVRVTDEIGKPHDFAASLQGEPRALFIAEFDDPHVIALRKELTKYKFKCFVWDSSRIHTDLPVYMNLDKLLCLKAVNEDGAIETLSNFSKHDLVILRRLPPPVQPDGPNVKAMEHTFRHFIQGMAFHLNQQTTMTPRYHSTIACERKLFQYFAASQVKMPLPDTIIGNDADAAAALFEDGAKVCFKPLKAEGWVGPNGRPAMMPTRRIERHELDDNSVRRFPGIFQREIEKTSEARALVSQDSTVAVQFTPKSNELENSEIDWRLWEQQKLDKQIIKIPNDILKCSRKLLKKLDLDFGVFDFCIEGNAWYFLEVNPFGNFLGMHPQADVDGIDLITACLKRRLECFTSHQH